MPHTEHPRDPIVAAFERRTARNPEAPLVVSPTRCARAGEVEALARAAATRLAAGTLSPDELVLLAAPNGPGFLAGWVALRRARLVPVLVDANTPARERQAVATRLGAAAVLSCAQAWPTGPEDWTLATERHQPGSAARRTLSGIGAVKLSSGSAGEPRGIAVTSEALASDDDQLVASMGITAGDRLLATVPLAHSYGLSSLAVPALRRGTLLVVPDGPAEPWAPLRAAEAASATVFFTVPSYLEGLLGGSAAPPWPASLRRVVSAGALLAPATAARFHATFGRRVHVFYGASECGGICYDREGLAAERGTVGAPVDGVQVTLPADGLSGEGGVVVVSSPAVASGYLPEAGEGLRDGSFVTADRAAWRDGELALLGRVDDWISVRGMKVNPREVESVLQELPGVSEAVVLGVPPMVPGREQIVRAVVACGGALLAEAEVRAWCRSRLAAHKVPRSIVLVREIPRTGRGKLDRARLLAAGGPAVGPRGRG